MFSGGQTMQLCITRLKDIFSQSLQWSCNLIHGFTKYVAVELVPLFKYNDFCGSGSIHE